MGASGAGGARSLTCGLPRSAAGQHPQRAAAHHRARGRLRLQTRPQAVAAPASCVRPRPALGFTPRDSAQPLEPVVERSRLQVVSGEGWMLCAHVPGLPAAIAVLEGTAWHRRPAIGSRCLRLFCPVNSAPCSEAALEGARCSLPEASRTEAERAPGAAWGRSAPNSGQRH